MLIYCFTDIDAPFGVAEPRLLGLPLDLDGLAEGASVSVEWTNLR